MQTGVLLAPVWRPAYPWDGTENVCVWYYSTVLRLQVRQSSQLCSVCTNFAHNFCTLCGVAWQQITVDCTSYTFSVLFLFFSIPNWCTMLSDRFRLVRILLVLFVLLVPSSANDALSAPRVYLPFKGKRLMSFFFLALGLCFCLFVCLMKRISW